MLNKLMSALAAYATFEGRVQETIERFLAACLDECPDLGVNQTARYTVMAGGQSRRGLAGVEPPERVKFLAQSASNS